MTAARPQSRPQTWEQMVAQSVTAGELHQIFLADRISKMPAAEFAAFVRNGLHVQAMAA